ncbi:MAG: hypothetical protein IJ189_01445 [Clostridia bacterium]|nr:hypothetical protein [Clostridia bacterium]
MAQKHETNMDRLTRHRADLARAIENRDRLNARIARLQETVTQETNQEYLLILSSASISLDDLRLMVQNKAALPAEPTKKEVKENEKE